MRTRWWDTDPVLVVVSEVVDGDTVTVDMPWMGDTLRWRVRLHGINTPELHRGDNREAAQACRAMLQGRLEGKAAILVCHEDKDSFGRLIGTLYALPTEPSPDMGDALLNALGDDDVKARVRAVLPLCEDVNQWMLAQGPGTVEFKG